MINLNHGVLMGRVIGINTFESNIRLAIAVNDDYQDKNKQFVSRSYVVNVSFFGENQIKRIIKSVNKGTDITVEYKLTSYVPKNSQYHTTTVSGVNFYVNSDQDNAQSTNSSKSNKRSSTTSDDDDVPF